MSSSNQRDPADARAGRPLWRLAGPLAMRCWDGDYVAYSSLSGNTHFLDILSGRILSEIADRPVRDAELRQLTADFLEVPDDDRVAQHVAGTLAALDELGLIERH